MLYSLCYVHFSAFTLWDFFCWSIWVHLLGCIHLGEFTWCNLLWCIQLAAFTLMQLLGPFTFHFVKFTRGDWLSCIYLVTFIWLHHLVSIIRGHTFGCIYVVAVTWLHSEIYIQSVAFVKLLSAFCVSEQHSDCCIYLVAFSYWHSVGCIQLEVQFSNFHSESFIQFIVYTLLHWAIGI